jgi:Arc/MetJ-type ribon-helix-helix transcriptional regulator
VLELARELEASEAEPPDAAGELADAVSALRLATAGAIAAGPVVFERLDFRPLRISPLLPIAATQPRGEPIRLDALRARLAADLRERLPLADHDRALADALDRWELSLFAEEPFRSGQVRDALAALLGGDEGGWAAAMRAAVLLGEKTKERTELLDDLRAERIGGLGRNALRRALVETLRYGNRAELVRTLDETLLGARPRPAAARAA